MKEHEHASGWYYRKDGEIYGPYVAGLLSRYILLGRISKEDEVSSDGQRWQLVQDTPAIIPDVMKGDQSDPEVQQRLVAAMRWADERQMDRRANEIPTQEQRERRMAGDRRMLEGDDVLAHRQLLWDRKMQGKKRLNVFLGWLVVFAAVGTLGGIGWYVYQNPEQETYVDCNADAVPGVNFSNCIMSGVEFNSVDLRSASFNNTVMYEASLRNSNLENADLRYADFSFAQLQNARLVSANLTGTNLRNANLDSVNLSGANLSFANLTGADIRSANLTDVNLHQAYWIDGTVCAPGSIGRCAK